MDIFSSSNVSLENLIIVNGAADTKPENQVAANKLHQLIGARAVVMAAKVEVLNKWCDLIETED